MIPSNLPQWRGCTRDKHITNLESPRSLILLRRLWVTTNGQQRLKSCKNGNLIPMTLSTRTPRLDASRTAGLYHVPWNPPALSVSDKLQPKPLSRQMGYLIGQDLIRNACQYLRVKIR